jgi:4-hydroxy-tetrahydrodipicolinate synthase
VRHFTVLAEATPLPCILYNIPSRTSLNMTAETTLRLAQVPNIVGIKEASGDIDQVRALVEGAPDGFRIWSGDDSAARWMVELGCYGVISVAAHLVGKQVSELVAAAAEGRTHDAQKIEAGLMPLFDVLFVETNPIPVKYALTQLGIRAGEPRLPLVPPSEAAQELIRAELARHRMDIAVPV